MQVPTVHSLDEIYDSQSLLTQGQRYQSLIDAFEARYERKVEFIVRSPGRVNLIGEHIDYCGFGVLPMAIEKDMVMAVATTKDDTMVRVANVNPKYEARTFDNEGPNVVTIDATKLEWTNYFKCGYKGMLERHPEVTPKGMFVLADGAVPAGSGLSSSAAFVCTSALAVITANQMPLSKQELTEIAIVAERNVGVNSGGMDQSASVFSEKDYALFVDFVPKLHTELVQLPTTQPPMTFIIANTLVTADKFTTAPKNYNLRVVETKVGALILARHLGLEPLDTYRQVMDAYFADSQRAPTDVDERFDEMLRLVDKVFDKRQGYTREELAPLSGLSEDVLVERYMTRFPVVTDVFRLYQRARHVFSEAQRVLRFIAVCKEPASGQGDILERLGALMNESQMSCDQLFNCSCDELNELTLLARQHGAVASRLTGAGWGGACVTLTNEERAPAVIEAMKTHYYRKHYPDLTDAQLEDVLLCTKPCRGAAIFDIESS